MTGVGAFTQKGNVSQKGVSIDGCFGQEMRVPNILWKSGYRD